MKKKIITLQTINSLSVIANQSKSEVQIFRTLSRNLPTFSQLSRFTIRSQHAKLPLPEFKNDSGKIWFLQHSQLSQPLPPQYVKFVLEVSAHWAYSRSQWISTFSKFCSEAVISAWGSFTCRKSTTRDPRLYFPSEGSHTQDFYALKTIHRLRPGSNLRTSDPEASMITTGPPRSTMHSMVKVKVKKLYTSK